MLKYLIIIDDMIKKETLLIQLGKLSSEYLC